MEFTAKWITSPVNSGVAVYTYTKRFTAKAEVKKATLYATAMGVYVPYVNGTRVGDNVLAPGWTSYKKRVQYQTYDVTELLGKDNCLQLGVGQGWAVGHIGYHNQPNFYSDHSSVFAELHITYADGSEEKIVTDESFEVYTSTVTFNEIYHGETNDKTVAIEKIGMAKEDTVETTLVAQVGEDIVENERLKPISLIVTPKGERVLDFGQNMTGYVQVDIKGNRGDKIVMHPAEVFDSEGNFYMGNYRTAKNEITYVLSGEQDSFKPLYTFQGFRYIRLTEYPFDEVDLDAFTAISVNSRLTRTGQFISGNEKINQLYHNIIWGQKSNYLDIPTDCPQRDERLGWTGDAQVFCRTAAINFDVERFFKKWLGDVALEQREDGAVFGIVPHCLQGVETRISAAWGDAACICPWQLYLAYGNKEILKDNFTLMKRWVEYMHHTGPEEYLWLTGMHYGDWLAMDAGPDSYEGATSTDLIASAFFAYSTELLVKAGDVLGEDVEEYRALYANIVKRFREYFMEDGFPKKQLPYTEIVKRESPANNQPVDILRQGLTQTALVLILKFNLCRPEERKALGDKLAQMVRENGNKMTTGFVGTPYIMHALTEAGYTDLAYELLFQEGYPSWLYSVTRGATTMWEHWNSLKEDGSFWSTAMNSFNHYAYGAVFDWIFGVAVGIQPCEEAPGYQTVNIAPHPDKRLGFVKSSIDSRKGKISMHWYYKGDVVYYEIEIPQGVTANLTLPSGKTSVLQGGRYFFAE